MSNLTPPPKLAQLIFLVTNDETAALAYNIGNALEALDTELTIWSFLDPVHEAAVQFIEDGYQINFADPRHPHGDLIKSLTTWAEGFFGEDYFGTMAHNEVCEERDFGNDQTIVFRDATWQYVKPFLTTSKPHELVLADLVGAPTKLDGDLYRPFAERHLIFGKPTIESVVRAIVEASK